MVRLNAFPVTQVPSVCRRVVCKVGGYTEPRAADKVEANILSLV